MQAKSRNAQERGPLPPSSGPIVGDHNVDTQGSSTTKKKRSSPVARPLTRSPDPGQPKTLSRGSSPEIKAGTEKRKSPINDRRSPSGERERRSPANLRASPVITAKTTPWRATGKGTASTARRPIPSTVRAVSGGKPSEKYGSGSTSTRSYPHFDDHAVSFPFEDAFFNGPGFESRYVHHSCQAGTCPNTMHVIHHAHAAQASCMCCEGNLGHRVLTSAVDEVSQTQGFVESATQTGTPPSGSLAGSPVEEQFLSLAQEFAEAERALKAQQDAQRNELRRQWIDKIKEVLPAMPGLAEMNKLCSRLQSAFVNDAETASAVTQDVVASIDIPKGGARAERKVRGEMDLKRDEIESQPVKDSSYPSSGPVEFHESPDFDALIADDNNPAEGTAVWDSELVALMASRLGGSVGGVDVPSMRLSNDEIEEEVMKIIADVNEREIKKARLGRADSRRAIGDKRPPAPDAEQMLAPEDIAEDVARVKRTVGSAVAPEFTFGSPSKNCTFKLTTEPPGTAHQTSAQLLVPKLDIAAVKAIQEGVKNAPDLSKHCHTLSSPRSAFSAPEKSTASSASNDESGKPSPYPSPRVVMTAAALRAMAMTEKNENTESFKKVRPSGTSQQAWK